MTTQSRALRLADQLTRQPWAFGYPFYALTNDGAALCHHCTKTEREAIGTTTGSDGWTVVALQPNWEDPELFCDHCGARIESAYADS